MSDPNNFHLLTPNSGIAAGIIGLFNRITLFQDSDIGYTAFVITLCRSVIFFLRFPPRRKDPANLEIKNSFVEAAVGVICSSMPAMASFSKLYIRQMKLFTTLQSRSFWHRNGSERIHDVKTFSPDASGKKGKPNATAATTAAKYSADSFPADSFSHLRHDSHHSSDRENMAAYPRYMTETSVQVGSESSRRLDLEIGRIEKCVTITQVSNKATDDSSFPVRFMSS